MRVDYVSCVFCPQPDQDDHVLNLQFSWHGLVKPVGSAFIGTSPEFEMAVFTIVFLMNTERSTTVLVNIDQCQMELVVIRHGRSLGTAYPKLLSSNSRHIQNHSHWCEGSSISNRWSHPHDVNPQEAEAPMFCSYVFQVIDMHVCHFIRTNVNLIELSLTLFQ